MSIEVIITVGCPASGKSTWSTNFVKQNEGWIRTSRDDFRFMLKNMPFCDSKIENMISSLQQKMILEALKNKLNVIIDNTNVKLKYINEFIKLIQPHANITFKVFDEPIDVLLSRDKAREKSVGEEVIKRMFKDYQNLIKIFDFKPILKNESLNNNGERFYLKQDESLEKAIICDIDGTLALKHPDRNIFDESLIYMDYVNEPVANILRKYDGKIIIVSGRHDSCLEQTKKWLLDNNIPFNDILMRKSNDFRSDDIVKKEIFDNNIRNNYYIEYVLDDRDKVVKLWRDEIGLLTLQVYYGNF